MYYSTGYIHRKKMGPHNRISFTRWTIKWTIMSKNDRGKYISNWQRTMVASFSKSSNCRESMTLLQIELKTKHKWVMETLTLSGKILWIATANSCCTNTRKSWDFKPTNSRSLRDTRLLTFEEYPCGTFRLRRHWQKLLFCVVDIVWHAGGRYVRRPCDIGCYYFRIPMSTKSWWNFKPSFVLPLMLRKVPIKLSQTFFSTCITSRQWRTCRYDHYGRSKNIDLFLPYVRLRWWLLLGLPKDSYDVFHTIIKFVSN